MKYVDKAAIQLGVEELAELQRRLPGQIREAIGARRAYILQVEAARRLMRNVDPMTAPIWEDAPQLAIPLLKAAKNVLLARAEKTLLSPTPLMNVEGWDEESKKSSKLVEQQLEYINTWQARTREAMKRAFSAAFDDGVAPMIGEVYTDTRTDWTWAVAPEGIETYDPETKRVLRPGETYARPSDMIVQYPNFSFVPIDKIGTYYADNASWQRSHGVWIETCLYAAELQSLAVSPGEGHFALYDKEQVELLLTQRPSGDQGAQKTEDEQARKIHPQAVNTQDKSATPYRIYELYWRLPRNGRTEDWRITIHEPSGIILRATPNPWWLGTRCFQDGQRPVVGCVPYSDKFGVVGDSLADLAGDTVRAENLMVRLMLASMWLGIDPEILVSAGMGETDIEELQKGRKPGRLIPMQTDSYLDRIKPFIPGYNPQSIIPIMQHIHGGFERTMGVSDPAMGRQMDKDATAFEISETLAGGNELGTMTHNNLARTLADIGAITLDMLYQFQGNEAIQRSFFLPTNAVDQDYTAVISGRYYVTTAGLREVSNRALRARIASQKVMMFTSNPIFTPMVMADPTRMYALAKDYLVDVCDEQNVERIIGKEPEPGQGVPPGGLPGIGVPWMPGTSPPSPLSLAGRGSNGPPIAPGAGPVLGEGIGLPGQGVFFDG